MVSVPDIECVNSQELDMVIKMVWQGFRKVVPNKHKHLYLVYYDPFASVGDLAQW